MTLRGILPVCNFCETVLNLVYHRTRGKHRKFSRIDATICTRCNLLFTKNTTIAVSIL